MNLDKSSKRYLIVGLSFGTTTIFSTVMMRNSVDRIPIILWGIIGICSVFILYYNARVYLKPKEEKKE